MYLIYVTVYEFSTTLNISLQRCIGWKKVEVWCLCWMLRHHSDLPLCSILMTAPCRDTKAQPTYLIRITLEGHTNPTTPYGISWALCATAWKFTLPPYPLLSPALPHRCYWWQHSLIKLFSSLLCGGGGDLIRVLSTWLWTNESGASNSWDPFYSNLLINEKFLLNFQSETEICCFL